jgi:malate/lactate dehydrogenase
MHTIQVIGVGKVGSTIAFGILSKELGHVILTDADEPRLDAEFYDLSIYAKHIGLDSNCYVRKSSSLVWASVYVFCCGKARRDDSVSRESLFADNWKIIQPYVDKIAVLNPEAWCMIVTNPSTMIAKECMSYLPRVIPIGLLTDKIEDSLSCLHGSHECNKKDDVGLQIFKTKGYTCFGVCGEVIRTIQELEE